MRILVTGSRTWTDRRVIFQALAEAAGHFPDDAITLVHGGARGADSLASGYAVRMGWTVEEHPAKWDKYGKAAGFFRNAEMVNLGAHVVLAFIKDNSPGATHCANYAEAAGLTVVRYLA